MTQLIDARDSLVPMARRARGHRRRALEAVLPLLCRSECRPLSFITLYADGKAIGPELRTEMIEASRAGKHLELEFTARTFLQAEGKSNRNFVRFRPGALGKMARSGKGTPFLRNHAQDSQADRGGTVLSSKAVKLKDGSVAFDQRIKLTAPWAVQGALEGNIDRFSIGWHPTGPIHCSACDTPVLEKCWHYPGQRLEEDGATRTVEWIFQDADLVEVSSVNVPAVVGTGITEQVRAALSAVMNPNKEIGMADDEYEDDEETKAADDSAEFPPEEDEDEDEDDEKEDEAAAEVKASAKTRGVTPMKRLKAALGLPRSASSDQVVKAVVGLKARAELDRAKALEQAIERDVEAAIADGRLRIHRDKDGHRVPSPTEQALRSLAESLGYEAFHEQIGALPKLHGPPRASTVLGSAPPDTGSAPAPSPTIAAFLRESGMTHEQLEQHDERNPALRQVLSSRAARA